MDLQRNRTMFLSGFLSRFHSKFSSLSLLIFNSLFLWLFFSFGRRFLGDADLVENYAWGMTWTLGNNKHPPLFSWITGAWFKLLPTSNWAYFLMNELNLLITLILLMLCLRKFFSEDKVYIALALTITVLPFGFTHGYKYNANLAQLPFMAGYAWALITAFAEKTNSKYALAGLFAGCAILCKYSAVVFLGSITFALWLKFKPNILSILPKLLIVASVVLLVTAPHFYWEIQHGWPTIQYMHASHPSSTIELWLYKGDHSLVKLLEFVVLPVIITIVAIVFLPTNARSFKFKLPEQNSIGLMIFTISVLATIAAAYTEHVNIVSDWFIISCLFFGWALVDVLPELTNTILLKQNVNVLIMIYFIAFFAIYSISERQYQNKIPTLPELPEMVAKDVTRLYHNTYHKPIEYAAGSFPLPYFLSFTSPDHPLGAFELDLKASNWIDANKFKAGRKVIVCADKARYSATEYPVEPICSQQAIAMLGLPDSQTMLKYLVYDKKLKAQISVEYHLLMYRG